MISKTSIIIRAYNEEKHIAKLLTGLNAQTRQPDEIILVDSGSTDMTTEIAKRYDVKIVNINKSEFTFGRSLNIGCATAKGDILLFLSAHTYPLRSDWLENMVIPFSDNRVACVYGKQRGNQLTKFSEHQVFQNWFPDSKLDNPDSYFCNNANCAVRKDKWSDHPYDENLPGLEDLKWAKAMHMQGYKIHYSPEATIIHVHEESWGQIGNRYYRESIALREIEPSVRISAWHCLRSLVSSVISDSSIALRKGLFTKNILDIFRFRCAQYYGIYQSVFTHSATSQLQLEQMYFPKQKAVEHMNEDNDTGQLLENHIDYSHLTTRETKTG